MPATFGLLCFNNNSVHLIVIETAGRLPCIWRCPSYEPAVQGWGNCHPHGRCCSNTIHCSCTPWLSHWTSLWSADSLEKREGGKSGFAHQARDTHSGWNQKSIPPSETLLIFYLFYPRDIFHSIKNRNKYQYSWTRLKKHTLTWASVTKSSDSSQKTLSTSQETKVEDLLVRHWAFKSHGLLKIMAWSLDRPHSTVCLLQRAPIFPTREWASIACLQECKPAPADSQKGCWLGR